MSAQRKFRGASMIEFALIFPIAFFLITGFIDLGRAVFFYSSLTNAVREATRFAIVNAAYLDQADKSKSDNALQDKVMEYAFGLTTTANPLSKDDIDVEVEKDGYKFLKVIIEVNYQYQPITPGIQAIFGDSDGIDLIARSQMLVSPGSQYLTE